MRLLRAAFMPRLRYVGSRRQTKGHSVLTLLAVVSLVLASPAAATELTYRHLLTSFPGTTGPWSGARVTVNNPASGERYITKNPNTGIGDTFITSAWASAGDGQNGIQTGVLYTLDYPYPGAGDCDKGFGTGTPTMYYFTEVEEMGQYRCQFDGYANTTDSFRKTVLRDAADGFWKSYHGGSLNGGSATRWDESCLDPMTGIPTGQACAIYAFGEEVTSRPGEWYAKFAGTDAQGHCDATSNNDTPWQRRNGTAWTTIQSAQLDPYTNNWDLPGSPFGPFPCGIWHFRYFKQGSPTGIYGEDFPPVGDTYVAEAAPSVNYGSSAEIQIASGVPTPSASVEDCVRDSSGILALCSRDGLLKFDASGLQPGQHSLIFAKLRLCALNASVAGGDIALTVDAQWDEGTVTWPGPSIDGLGSVSVGPVIAGQCYEVDVTDLVWNYWWDGQAVYSFRISSRIPIEVKYASKEAGLNLQPMLSICTSNLEWC